MLHLHPEVQAALVAGKPVVALESTIISHGMPYPQNVETARRVEQTVRDHGATPATIAIIEGVPTIGLTAEELEIVASTPNVLKVSRRDLPFVVAQRLNGATTVAATMILADLAGIRVFATGGIGGVHRGAQETFDISADLDELAHTNVAVVCAGAKSILDLGLTLEYLETKGVPVIGYQTDELPAFYTRQSGFGVDYRLDDVQVLAKALQVKWQMGLQGGVVIANPIPAAYEMDHETIRHAIENALQEAEQQGIKGKESTPFLLAKIKDITGGSSLESNIQLVLNNAQLAAQLAVAFCELG
ncbi:MAG: pseudouridine-5'-phosphate glycosidase [Spirosomataceae bacterium]